MKSIRKKYFPMNLRLTIAFWRKVEILCFSKGNKSFWSKGSIRTRHLLEDLHKLSLDSTEKQIKDVVIQHPEIGI